MASPSLDLSNAFSRKDRERMRKACRALRTSYEDFIVFSVRQSLDELEGIAEQVRQINRYYGHDS